MNPKHNLKFVESAILQLRSEITADVARLEALLKDPAVASTNDNLVEDICRLARRCVAADAAAGFLQQSLPTPAAQPPPPEPSAVAPPIRGEDLAARSPTMRRNIKTSKKKEKS